MERVSASNRIGLGSQRRWPYVGSGRIWDVFRPADGDLPDRVRTERAIWQCHHFEQREVVRSMGNLPRRRSLSDGGQQKCRVLHLWPRFHPSLPLEADRREPVEPEPAKTDWGRLAGDRELCWERDKPPVYRK